MKSRHSGHVPHLYTGHFRSGFHGNTSAERSEKRSESDAENRALDKNVRIRKIFPISYLKHVYSFFLALVDVNDGAGFEFIESMLEAGDGG
jgi:hypothetical protein